MSVLAPGRNIVLIGMMGAGKSAVSRHLGAWLEREVLDTDKLVESEAGTSIAEIFAAEGENGFRRREAAVIREVAALRGRVVSVGGGAVTDPANVTQLRGTGDVVWLDGTPDALAGRISPAGRAARPLLADAEDLISRLAWLLAEREPAYRAAAATTVDTTGKSSEAVALEVLEWAKQAPGLLTREERR